MQLIKQTVKIIFYFRLYKYRKFVQFSIFLLDPKYIFTNYEKVKDFLDFILLRENQEKSWIKRWV